MKFEHASRIESLPPYPFAKMEELVSKKRKEGLDIISFGIGDPDLPPPQEVMEILADSAKNASTHKYSVSAGEDFFREAVVEWYYRRYEVSLDPDTEVSCMGGSKEGLVNIARAFVEPGSNVLCPSPAYPVYAAGASVLSEGKPVKFSLLEKNNYLPELLGIDYQNTSLIYLNYPNNPTGALASEELLREAAARSSEASTPLCYDHAYSEMVYGDNSSPSILGFSEGMNSSIEFNSFSKMFNMPGDRVGFAAGNSELVSGLKKIKSQVDSGIPIYIQEAAAHALSMFKGGIPSFIRHNVKIYEERLKILVKSLKEMGFRAKMPGGTFYLWLPVFDENKTPEQGMSWKITEKLLEAGVVVTPGTGFGAEGEGYIRFAATVDKERIKEAMERINDAGLF